MTKAVYRGVSYNTEDKRNPREIDEVLTYRGVSYRKVSNTPLELVQRKILKERALHDAQLAFVRSASTTPVE